MTPRLRERCFPRWLWRLPAGRGQIALTFDDGPHPETTPLLREELAKLGIASTHFVNGSRCSGGASLLKELAAAGQAIENHGYEHRSLLLAGSAEQTASIVRTAREVERVQDRPTTLYRPCHGHFNPWTQQALAASGHRGVLWSVIVYDWRPQTDSELWDRLRAQLHDGAIIALHDGHPTTEAVIRLLPRLADEVARRGWHFVTLTDPIFSPTFSHP